MDTKDLSGNKMPVTNEKRTSGVSHLLILVISSFGQ